MLYACRVGNDGRIEVRWIDFEWAGVASKEVYPEFMNHRDVPWPSGVSEGLRITAAKDKAVLLATLQASRRPPRGRAMPPAAHHCRPFPHCVVRLPAASVIKPSSGFIWR